jgi:hypothetical protein
LNDPIDSDLFKHGAAPDITMSFKKWTRLDFFVPLVLMALGACGDNDPSTGSGGYEVKPVAIAGCAGRGPGSEDE